jgi:hypothetical protein
MGKVYKRKRRACELCKPHKRGWVKRRKVKEASHLQAMDQKIREQDE